MLALAVVASCAPAGEGIAIHDAAVGESANGVTAGVYAVIENAGPADDLVAISSPAAEHASLHVMEEDNGIMTMRPTPSFALPARGTLELRPGARHGMLEGLTRSLNVGDTVAITFTFASGVRQTIEAPVRSLLDLRGR